MYFLIKVFVGCFSVLMFIMIIQLLPLPVLVALVLLSTFITFYMYIEDKKKGIRSPFTEWMDKVLDKTIGRDRIPFFPIINQELPESNSSLVYDVAYEDNSESNIGSARIPSQYSSNTSGSSTRAQRPDNRVIDGVPIEIYADLRNNNILDDSTSTDPDRLDIEEIDIDEIIDHNDFYIDDYGKIRKK